MAVVIKVEYGFYDLIENCWSGALDTLNTIQEHEKNTDLMALLEELDFEGMTDLNDFLWFDRDYIYETLGITEDNKEEE